MMIVAKGLKQGIELYGSQALPSYQECTVFIEILSTFIEDNRYFMK